MPTERSTDDARDLEALTGMVRRLVAANVHDPHTIEDLVQEVIVRVASVEDLEPEALAPYAVATTRNVLASHGRVESRRQRHIHRLVEYRHPRGPEEVALEAEETKALALALERLPEEERAPLLAHEVEGQSTRALAKRAGTSAGAMAVRLARARAALRLEFLLALRQIESLEPRCRAVLMAFSERDRRSQRRVEADRHLRFCQVCTELVAPLAERRRSLAGAAPLIAIAELMRRLARNGKVQAGTAAAASAGVVVAAFAIAAQPEDKPPPTPPSTAAAAAPVQVLFIEDSPDLPPSADTQLNSVLAQAQARPAAMLQIEGFTDSDGDPTSNQMLSEQRANNVASWFTQRGIDPARMVIAGHGSNNPVAPNDTPENKAANRRVQITITQ
jgi:RNA polymerase sigma factor (sigma-70 family)